MSRYNQARRELAERIRKVRAELNAAIANHSNTRFQERWPTWKTMLAQIAKESEVCPEVPVALLGPTGAGKSTLINALLDAQLLPVNVAKICTASVTEVAYSESPAYEATIEFVTEDEGRKEFDTLAGELADAEALLDASSPEEGVGLDELSKAAREKIVALNRPENPSGLRLSDIPGLKLPLAVARACCLVPTLRVGMPSATLRVAGRHDQSPQPPARPSLVPTLRVGMPPATLRVAGDYNHAKEPIQVWR